MNYDLKMADYDYELPDERIAKYPLPRRDQSKLLVYDRGAISEDCFANLADRLPDDALMVFNNTKVIHARLHFRKATGALIEIFLLEPVSPSDYEQAFGQTATCRWNCLVGNQKKWKEGTLSAPIASGTLRVTRVSRPPSVLPGGDDGIGGLSSPPGGSEGGLIIEFAWDGGLTFSEIIEQTGQLPIPPYLHRETEESDKTTYQTVYSKIDGSVAAPTAGLHFTPEVLAAIDSRGIRREELTLHVGAGTFKPVKTAGIADHDMHTEHISVRRQTIEQLLAHGCRAIAVGTTSVRTLESLYYIGARLHAGQPFQSHVGQWEPYTHPQPLPKGGECFPPPQGGLRGGSPAQSLEAILRYLDQNRLDTLHASTQIIIVPGYSYKYVRALVTNFHQPRSTLLLLVSALVGDDWRTIYRYALDHQFRFLSYGDSSLLIPKPALLS
ncbi:MAG: S-adenosylmethionine:tRNA ribosyltransferase-isomerase [Prevotella sp.]|nr:S-adenosylmethionine:tRNA ribosyltransferase-isomerase [Prevotella sp.]